ncbi:MAG: hypothetical protein BMS9Abin05_0192 [Rhodothermia bacterium]|nr:MAG: hypothetical protein BMS9Abin05_0192 [Rhodothermia bacterium]
MTQPVQRRKFYWWTGILTSVAVIIFLAITRGLYFFPTFVALGPCLPDWTSPSTYLAVFEEPASPMKKTRFKLGKGNVQICYGSPSARGRSVFNNETLPDSLEIDSPRQFLVPNGRLWRLGANEPTRIFIDRPIFFGDIRLDPGRYSMYTIPGSREWEIFITRSTFHWGNQISSEVRSKEVGSTRVPVSVVNEDTEELTFKATDIQNDSAMLRIQWSNVSVNVPVVSSE